MIPDFAGHGNYADLGNQFSVSSLKFEHQADQYDVRLQVSFQILSYDIYNLSRFRCIDYLNLFLADKYFHSYKRTIVHIYE